MDLRDRLFEFLRDPSFAHSTFFSLKHANADAPFHAAIERDWHSSIPNVLTMAFRGSAKSTKAEEAIALEVCFRRVKNVLILGESETRASERLTTIKSYFEYDELLQGAFDIGPGPEWTATKAITSTGVMMQAAGRGQSLRGVKHLEHRPDFIFLDDIEDKESGSVATPEARKKTRAWLAGTVLPTLAPGGRMRMAATPLHPEALAPTLSKADRSWTTRTYPIVYRDADSGEWRSAWPDRFPLPIILKMWEDYKEIGEEDTFYQEYLCQAVDPASQTFTEDMFIVEPRVRSYHAVYAIYDPARTTNKQSATTGKAVASWIGNRLVVWESSAKKWMPDEIVNDIFATNDKYSPTAIGVEQDGLNEWLLQPIRTQQIERGTVIPLRPLRAPKGKFDFIRGLQPYFAARSVVFADHMPDLRVQLLGFPGGHIDAPNALAYMLTMKLGVPIYDNFTDANIDPDARPRSGPAYLLLNTNNQITTGIAVQQQSGRLVILADWVLEGDPGTVLTELLEAASVAVAAGSTSPRGVGSPGTQRHPPLRPLSPPRQFDDYAIYGLRAACRKLGFTLARGGDPTVGREEIRGLFRRLSHGRAALSVLPGASWVLRAFAGGYARDANASEPIDNAYAVLVEALESFAGLMKIGSLDVASSPKYAYTSDGRRYISALVDRRPHD